MEAASGKWRGGSSPRGSRPRFGHRTATPSRMLPVLPGCDDPPSGGHARAGRRGKAYRNVRRWYDISFLEWMPDGNGLVAWPPNSPATRYQLWYVSYPDGDARRITNDLNDYGGVSLAEDSGGWSRCRAMTPLTSGWARPVTPRAPARSPAAWRISDAHLDWVGDSNVVFSAPDSQHRSHIWIAAADGTSQRQLTEDGPYDEQPSACGDGRRIVFLSYVRGAAHIWRSDLDGSNARQLTSGEGEFGPSCSPDGTWLALRLV